MQGSEIVRGIRNQIIKNIKGRGKRDYFGLEELKGLNMSVYNYRKRGRLVPKNLKKIGEPRMSLYDTCIKYFFTPAFKPKSTIQNFRSISPKPSAKI